MGTEFHKVVNRDFNSRAYRQAILSTGRRKRFPLIRVFLGVLVIGFTCSLIMPDNREPSADAHAHEQTRPVEKIVEEEKEIISGRIAEGSSYYALMDEHGVDRDRARLFYARFDKLDYGSFMPGDSFLIVIGRDDRLEQFAVRTPQRSWYRVTARADSLIGYVEEPDFRIEESLVHGVVKSNIYDAVRSQKESGELVVRFEDIFAWDINFWTEPRKGDEFELIVEKFYDKSDFVKYGRILAARYRATNETHEAFLFGGGQKKQSHYDEEGRAVQKMFLKAPLTYSRISSRFSYRRFHPVLRIFRAHPAVDYAAPPGTPVKAAADGVIEYAKWCGGYGKTVCMRHANGYKTFYGHLARYGKGIKRGLKVKQNRYIGYVGSTGLSTGPHLDYRVQRNGTYINPMRIKSPRNKEIPEEYRLAFQEVKKMRTAQLDKALGGTMVARSNAVGVTE